MMKAQPNPLHTVSFNAKEFAFFLSARAASPQLTPGDDLHKLVFLLSFKRKGDYPFS